MNLCYILKHNTLFWELLHFNKLNSLEEWETFSFIGYIGGLHQIEEIYKVNIREVGYIGLSSLEVFQIPPKVGGGEGVPTMQIPIKTSNTNTIFTLTHPTCKDHFSRIISLEMLKVWQ